MQGFTLLVFYFPIGFTESGPSADWPALPLTAKLRSVAGESLVVPLMLRKQPLADGVLPLVLTGHVT